jgi:NIMA (never in mitosis gene a)-related kinase
LTELFVDCLKEPEVLSGASTELITSIERLSTSLSAETKLQIRTAEWDTTSELGRGDSSVVRLARDPEGTLSAVKFPKTPRAVQLIKRDIAIHKELKHPLILECRESHPGMFGLSTTIITDFARNGSLASHLPSAGDAELCQLRGETRVARVIVSIVLAMRYLHSQQVIHCNLAPENILLDWDWNVRIGNFGHSISPDEPVVPIPDDPYHNAHWSFPNSHYLAPECYDSQYSWESDVFSFGLILYELVTREPAFPKHLNELAIAKAADLIRRTADHSRLRSSGREQTHPQMLEA